MNLDCALKRTRGVESVLWLLKAKPACRWVAMVMLAWTGLGPHTAAAFESKEHRLMGDLAAGIAFAYLKDMPGIDNNALRALGMLVPKPESKSPEVSYGQIVECVDYFLIPERIFSFDGRNPYPTGLTKVLEPDSNPLSKKLGGHCDAKAEGAGFIQASHFNHAHFQQDLLMSLRYGRLRAMSLARYEKNYYDALVANAIADHYLHDFFAPGHIVTPRNSLTDVLATAMHDLANQEGVKFAPSNLQVLKPILRFICGLDEKQILGTDDCQAGKGNWLDKLMDKNTIGDISGAMKVLAKDPPDSVIFRGDSYLWDTAQEQLVQRILLLAVEVRSIIHVIRGSDDPGSYDWKYEPTTGKVTARFEFGEYVVAGAAEAPDSRGGQYLLQTMSPILAFSVSRESLFAGLKVARNVVSAEAGFPLVMARTGFQLLPNLVVVSTVGYSVYEENNEYFSGPTFRMLFAIPETEFSIGPYFRRLSYPTSGGGEARRNSWGFRADFGFTGYFTMFAMVGSDYGTFPNGKLDKDELLSLGFAISFPWSRVSRLAGR